MACKKQKNRKYCCNSMSSSTSSAISTKELRDIVEKLKLQGHRDSTRKNYHAIWKIFSSRFYLSLDEKPVNWEDRIVLVSGYLVNDNKCPSTVKSYISAIKTVLKEDNIDISEDRYILNSLTKACRYTNCAVKIRLPIHRDLLHLILKQIDSIFNEQPYLSILYKSILITGYYGLFRIGEITKGTHPIQERWPYHNQ